MSFFSYIQYQYLKKYSGLINANRHHAVKCQQETFKLLINAAKNTAFAKEHAFNSINSYEDFKNRVPLRSYNDYKPYIQRILNRETNVLCKGFPSFFAKSSGTSGETKLLPVTNDFLHSTQMAALYMLSNLSQHLGNALFIGSKVLTLGDQQELEEINGFLFGAISSIKMFNKPSFANWFSFPNDDIKNIHGANEKIKYIIQKIQGYDIQMIVALPVYLSHFLQQFQHQTRHKFKDIFPNFSVVFLSGMNYEPYEISLRNHLGNDVLLMENYSASEGNFAYQVQPNTKGMELICNQGIFYEFVELENIHNKNAKRISLKDVQPSKLYSIIISANNGLWAYAMNDIVEFVSTQPYRLIIKGRLNDIFSPFGEHMLPIQAEQSIAETCKQTNQTIIDFLIVPDFDHAPFRYKCYAAFQNQIRDFLSFSIILHQQLALHNSYYNDLAKLGALTYPELIPVHYNFFSSLFADENNNLIAQQKPKHLISDKSLITKIEEMISQ